jgi:hypothetical protein
MEFQLDARSCEPVQLNEAITSSGSSLGFCSFPRRTATSALRAGRKDPIGAVATSGSSNTPVAVASSPEPEGLSTAAAAKHACRERP